MIEEFSVISITFLTHFILKDFHLLTKIFVVIISFFTLKFFPQNASTLLQAIIAWNVFELADAFLNFTNYDDEYYKCTYTASTLKSEKIDEKQQEQNFHEKDSTLNSSEPQTEESKLQGVSMCVPQNMDVL